MGIAEDLEKIATDLGDLESEYVDGGSMFGYHLKTEAAARCKYLIVEAKSLIDEGLGPMNDYSINLISTSNAMRGISGTLSLAGLKEARELVVGAAKRVARKSAELPKLSPSAPSGAPPYVGLSRISELRLLRGRYDTRRLVRLCEELNIAHRSECHMTTAMLVRAITDHVPPIFSCASFNEVANNYSGAKSFRGSMQHLQNSLRHIADGHLHTQIRKSEVLPTPQQVDFSADLDALLSEVVRIESGAS
jgi:hypothetical protein